jgi:hypothetical protein
VRSASGTAAAPRTRRQARLPRDGRRQPSLQLLLDAGAQVQQEVKDVGGGKLIAWVKDADGNPIALSQSP